MCPAQFIPLYLGTESRANKGIATLKNVPVQIIVPVYSCAEDIITGAGNLTSYKNRKMECYYFE